MKKRLNSIFNQFLSRDIFVFLFFIILVFAAYHTLFQSYFEADEWFWFTQFLPFIKEPNGPLMAILKSVTGSTALSAGQHVDPLGIEIFFLNILFFRLNFIPYVVVSLLLHSVNSFLVFLLVRELLNRSKDNKKTLFAITSGIFFALTAIPMHAVTWVAFYGQNVLSVTFFLLSILFLVKGLNEDRKRFIILSSLFLFLDLLTKETAATLFLVIPFFLLLNKRTFSFKTLTKIYSLPLLFFIPFRFVLPLVYSWANNYSSSVHGGLLENLNLNLLLYRLETFPLKMISEVFFSYYTIQSFLSFIGPFVYPTVGDIYRIGGYMGFIYGPGLNFVVYLLSIILILIIIKLLINLNKNRKHKEFKTVLFGLFIIVSTSFPLIFNVLNLKWWGVDFFDVRHYYMPSVGAAILFPFIILFLGSGLAKFLGEFKVKIFPSIVIIIIGFLWFVENIIIFQSFIETRAKLATPRKRILTEIKVILPSLPAKAVIFTQPSLSAYFQTNIAQMLTVLYYDKNIPNEFYDNPPFWKKQEGYEEFKGRGFGYYFSKENLEDALLRKKFSIDDVYGFYYDDKKNQLTNITLSLRKELEEVLKAKNL